MRKTVIAVVALALALILLGSIGLCLGATAPASAEEDGGVAMVNPWVDTDAEGVMRATGLEFGVPEGAEDVRYAVLESEGLAEMCFTWEGMDYIARIKATAEFEDISGMYYDPWDYEEQCEIEWCEGVVKRTRDEGETVDLCLWFDAVPGVMYSVTTRGEDLDGFDIQAAALQLFLPMQGDADA